jgi:hypothetical protein
VLHMSLLGHLGKLALRYGGPPVRFQV